MTSRDSKQRLAILAARAGVHVVKDVARATHLIMTEGSATPKAVAALALSLRSLTRLLSFLKH